MLKFTKYFLLIFLISTFIPLLLMFLLDVIRIDQAKQNEHKQIVKLAVKQINTRANHYLYVTQLDILKIIKVVKPDNKNLDTLKDFLEAYSIDWINQNDKFIENNPISKDSITSYFLVKTNNKSKLKLYAVFILPYHKNNHFGLRILKEVDLKMLHPAGPFILHVYDSGSKNNHLIDIVEDEFEIMQKANKTFKKPSMFPIISSQKPHYDNKNPNDPTFISEKTYLKGLNNNNVAMLKLSLYFPPHPDRFLPFNFPLLPGLMILLAGFLVSLILGGIINVYFIQPLAIFSELTKKVKNGDFSIDPDLSFKQEEIQQTFENFKSMVLGLKEKEEIKNSFIENLTHDLKTPLISQERALELLAMEFQEANMVEQFQLAKGLAKNNKHLLKMINMILEACRFDFEEHNIELSEVNLYTLIQDCFQNVSSMAEEVNIVLLNNILEDTSTVLGDQITLKRVFLNLLSNSIDNLGNDGQIQVCANIHSDKVLISFEDNGTGISKEELPYIFDRYYSGKSDERKLGSGLGLFVCKKLIELNKGNISVETKVNEFTRFLIVLNKFK